MFCPMTNRIVSSQESDPAVVASFQCLTVFYAELYQPHSQFKIQSVRKHHLDSTETTQKYTHGHTDQCVCVWDRWRRGGQKVTWMSGYSCFDKETVTSSSLSLSLCLSYVHCVSLSLSILFVHRPFILDTHCLYHSRPCSFPLLSPIMTLVPCSCIPSSRHLTSLSPSLFVSLSLNYIFSVSPPKQGVLKLLIIIPGHEMVGRLGGGHIAAKVLQHTMWAELTEPRPRGSGRPQNGSIMENGSWVGGRLFLRQRPREVDTSLTGNQEPGGTCFTDYFKHLLRSCHIWRSRMCLNVMNSRLKFITIVKLIVLWIYSLNRRDECTVSNLSTEIKTK